MNLQENISTQLKRRTHLVDRAIKNLLPNMYPCDYNSSDHFVEGVLDEIVWFLIDVEELQGVERRDIEDYIFDYKYDEITNYFNEKCIVLKNDNLQESIRRILREETSLKTKIKDMISKHGFFTTSKIFGGVDIMNSILNIKGSQEEMIFIVKAIMENDIEVLINVCNYQIVPTIHSFKLYVEIPKYYPDHSDDYFPNKQKTFEARDYISDLIKKFGNEKVRGYNIYVQIGNC